MEEVMNASNLALQRTAKYLLPSLVQKGDQEVVNEIRKLITDKILRQKSSG